MPPELYNGSDSPTLPQDRPMAKPEDWTTPRQFRLSEETLSEMDWLAKRFSLRSRADVIRFLVRQAALANGFDITKESENNTGKSSKKT